MSEQMSSTEVCPGCRRDVPVEWRLGMRSLREDRVLPNHDCEPHRMLKCLVQPERCTHFLLLLIASIAGVFRAPIRMRFKRVSFFCTLLYKTLNCKHEVRSTEVEFVKSLCIILNMLSQLVVCLYIFPLNLYEMRKSSKRLVFSNYHKYVLVL